MHDHCVRVRAGAHKLAAFSSDLMSGCIPHLEKQNWHVESFYAQHVSSGHELPNKH